MISSDAGGRALLLTALESFSLVQPWREHASDCTYCRRHGNRGRISLTSFATRLTVFDYDTLLERGWMRSGSTIYLPSNTRSCCPNLPIRLDALRFEPSRTQRSAVRRAREALAGLRAIVLPERLEDPLLRCLELAKEGRATEAVEAVLSNRLHRGEDGRADPAILARARALGIRFLSEDRDLADVIEGKSPGLGLGKDKEGKEKGEGMGDDEDIMEDDEKIQDVDGASSSCVTAPISKEDAITAAAGVRLPPSPPPQPMPPISDTTSTPVVATLSSPFAILKEGVSAESLTTTPAAVLTIIAAAIALRRALAGGAPFDAPPLDTVRIEAPSEKARRMKSSSVSRVPDAVCNAAFVLAAHARAAAGAGAGADGVASSVATELATRLAVAPPIGEGVIITVAVGGAAFLNINVDAQEGALVRTLISCPEFLDAVAKETLIKSQLAISTAPVDVTDSINLAALIPHELNSATAHTKAEREALAAFHTAQQAEREAAGRIAMRTDPFFADTGRDDSDGAQSDNEDEGENEKRRARQAEAFATDVIRSVTSLKSIAADGVGSVAGARRLAAVEARIARGGGGPLLPFGTGPLELRCSIKRPAYSLEAHELYGRFNMALHRGKPSSEERENFVRHLVDTVIVPTPAWSVGAALSVAHPETRDAHEVEAEAARTFFRDHTDSISSEVVAVQTAGLGENVQHALPPPLPYVPPAVAAIITGLPAFALSTILDLPPPCEPLIAASWGEVLRSLSIALGEPLLAPEPTGMRGGVVDELEDMIRCDYLAAWQLADVARALSPESLRKAHVRAAAATAEAVRDGNRGARSILSVAAGAPIHVLPARAPPPERFATLPSAFGPFLARLRTSRSAGGQLPASTALALYAVAVDIVNGAKAVLSSISNANKQRAAWKDRSDGAVDLAKSLFASPEASDTVVDNDNIANTLISLENDATKGSKINLGAHDVRHALEWQKKKELEQVASRAAAAAVKVLILENARLARAEVGDFSCDEDMNNGDDEGAAADNQVADSRNMLTKILETLKFIIPEPPPTPAALLPCGPLTPEALADQMNKWLNRHDSTLAWLECATASMLREVSDTSLRSISVAEAVGGGDDEGEQLTCKPLPSDSWFDSWIERAPTRGAGRHGATPLRDEAAYAAENATVRARAAQRGAILVEGWDVPLGLGTFFMEWHVGNTLAAVSVLDILPSRVASVYFFYDPDLRGALQLGKLSVLVEAWLAREMARFSYTHSFLTAAVPKGWGVLGGWLDLNFYVHACSQMKYKREFVPSEVLCPSTHVWVPLDSATLARLDAAPDGPLSTEDVTYEDSEIAAFEREALRDAESAVAEEGLTAVLCQLNDGRWYPFSDLSVASRESCKMSLAAWLRGVGPELGSRVLIDPNTAAIVGFQVSELRKKRVFDAMAKAEAARAAKLLIQHEAADADADAIEARDIALALELSQQSAAVGSEDDDMEKAIAASLAV